MHEHAHGFYGLGIAPGILGVVEKLRFHTPTPIQQQAIPIAIEGKDLMGIAQTGTGKTLAFGIPLIQRTLQDPGAGLVIAPTRELALQITESLERVGASLGLKTATLIGGESIGRQKHQLARRPQVIVGTPGRIIDHLEQKTLSLTRVRVLVLDEADRMLDMGFAPQLKRIVTLVPRERQTMLFSATMPEDIVSLARTYLTLPIRVEIARSGSTAKDVTQELFFVPQELKPQLLAKVLDEYRGSVLVFSRTKHGAKKIASGVRGLGHPAAEIHANRSLGQRKEALEGFKKGKYRVLVATDIAARGIDVQNIELVVNYDLPDNAEDYVHRIGRTGRAGGTGHAISFARPNQAGDVRAIERLTRIQLPVSKLPAPLHAQPFPYEQVSTPPPGRAPFRYQSRNPRSHSRFGSRNSRSRFSRR